MTTNTATNTATFTVNGTSYTLHLDGKAVEGSDIGSVIYRVTGSRKADGALCIQKKGSLANRPLVVGISALQRLNWWDLAKALEAAGITV
jgi:hypothetical protein